MQCPHTSVFNVCVTICSLGRDLKQYYYRKEYTNYKSAEDHLRNITVHEHSCKLGSEKQRHKNDIEH